MNRALRIGLVYLAVSVLWIVFSDTLLFSLDLDPTIGDRIQTLKGVAFVILSSLLVTVLAWREFASSQEAERYFEASPDLFAILELDRRVARLNSQWQAVLGTAETDVGGGWLARVVHPADQREASEVLGRVEAGERIQAFRCRLR
ncbi:MAG TPA: hypothetical protein VLA43_13530, partial [Longimicrobiales bacterium]|nr:hypothetical protein [Longimicrobiales bacterium]